MHKVKMPSAANTILNKVSQALQAYSRMVTNADKDAIR